MKKKRRVLQTAQLAGAVLMVLFLLTAFGCDSGSGGCGGPTVTTGQRPIVFVHGMAGSADQFSLQAQRFASNGYPAEWISGFEYDTTLANNTVAQIMTALDAHIDGVLAETGADQVDLVGHSMGTMMSQRYLNSTNARAAKVAHYVNVDGMAAASLPGDVPTLALWAAMTGENRSLGGATNVVLSSQTHVQSTSSAEAFAEMYTFFMGDAPDTVQVLAESSDTLTLAGKLVTFMTNIIPQRQIVDVYEVDAATGTRIDPAPLYTRNIGADGAFEFTGARAGKSYEFTAHAPTGGVTVHFYYAPFVRSSLLMRLIVSEPDSALSSIVETGNTSTNMVIVRDKELVGDADSYPAQPALENDSLTINGQELISASAILAQNATIGLYIYDAGSDGQSDVSQGIADFASIPFVNGLDLFLPAMTIAPATISVVLEGRQNGGVIQQINVPNWSSATEKITVHFDPL